MFQNMNAENRINGIIGYRQNFMTQVNFEETFKRTLDGNSQRVRLELGPDRETQVRVEIKVELDVDLGLNPGIGGGLEQRRDLPLCVLFLVNRDGRGPVKGHGGQVGDDGAFGRPSWRSS